MKPQMLVSAVLLAVCLFAFSTAGAVPALAATCNVPSGSYPTIASAATDSNCTLILVAAGTYHENAININHALTLKGAGRTKTFIDGDDSNYIFDAGAYTVTFDSVRIQHAKGSSGGGIISGGVLTVKNSAFYNNEGGDDGGAIYSNDNANKLTVVSSVFYFNSTAGDGAAIEIDGLDATIKSSRFTSNVCEGCDGGAIYTAGNNLSISDTLFTLNKAVLGTGGALYLENVTTTITNSVFRENGAVSSDGGLTPQTIVGVDGGAIYNLSALTITNSTFDTNRADGSGGAIYNGGAPWAGHGPPPMTSLNVSGSTFVENSNSGTEGGGAIRTFSWATLTNNTFDRNTTQADHGGALDVESGTTDLVNNTFNHNEANGDGGTITADGGTINLRDNILAFGHNSNCLNMGGTITSLGGNISSDNSCAAYLTKARDRNHTDPLFAPLANNGGPTLTHALKPGSPAIDNGVACPPPAKDQRGESRPKGERCDSGSVEQQ